MADQEQPQLGVTKAYADATLAVRSLISSTGRG
jgi:hypothetical protein